MRWLERQPRKTHRAFTLLELLVAISVIAVLAAIISVVMGPVLSEARRAKSTSNIRQLGMATHLYLADHDNQLFAYRETQMDGSNMTGVVWWFGSESASSLSQKEGNRSLDKTAGPLYPYLNQIGGVEICPGFAYDKSIWKPKYDGASYGYGYNVVIGGGWLGTQPTARIQNLSSASGVLLFATCAQVNTFQSPASSKNPLLEEFYGFDQRELTIHFRFNRRALGLFVDGHVEALPPAKGTINSIKPKYVVGRFTPVGSYDMLR